ncbi:hypothetical protein [Pacificibacter sp. 1_MG-2023]|uniref:hypothetical protein n=1 Tax=Pacificibacter sp. 1_MG-2023 TaxID=3062658 RepID=UPI0026E22259|nr:hypothetical protein [Pacificibacter sp. 1_MG-2023]MDO6614744.1 hypothetical protein [Pacificibacter sp. 1_MG-2023]
MQNPAYASVLAAFNRLQEVAGKTGIGGAEFEQIERINILHASALYERWCLVRLISLLTDTFGFTPELDWLDRVIEGVCGPLTSFDLHFNRSDLGMSAQLEIQPVLENGRRPDFRITFQRDVSEKEQKSSSGAFVKFSSDDLSGLILDAKFRTRWFPGEGQQVLQDIAVMRGYERSARRVFILQPAGNVVSRPTSPLPWGHDCDFGENEPGNHRQGIIKISPEPSAWMNLQRLISLELQASFPAPQKDDYGKWFSNSFCVSCGCRHNPSDVEHRRTQKDNNYWILTCQDCGLSTTRTHCFSGCGTSLFKNGLNMTYHRTISDQPSNIACPYCGEFFDRNIQNTTGDNPIR